ncbi:MAG: hypothetical protein JNK05_08610 [Myxococcales bacterium]|nr:hypothetical protein [Myxococcales bacterium]
MDRELVYETETMALYWRPRAKVIEHVILRYPGVQVLEAVLERGLALLEAKGAQKWLSDDRGGGALPKSHHEWAETVWGPKAARLGWKYWALVPPKELVGKLNMERLRRTFSALGVECEVCATPEEGLVWLDHR